MRWKGVRKSALFERDDDGIRLKGAFAKLRISEGLSDTLPLLSYPGITYMDNPIIKDVTEWFMYKLFFLNYGNPLDELILDVNPTEPMKGFFMTMLRGMDIDIEDYRSVSADRSLTAPTLLPISHRSGSMLRRIPLHASPIRYARNQKNV